MSNKTRKWRSAIAMVLVICMLFSIFPVAAFAEEPETKQQLVYVSIGDSMTNGYGLFGYDGSSGIVNYANDTYGNKFAAWLAGYTGEITNDQVIFDGPKATVDHRQLAMSGMRAEDLHWALELDYTDQALIDLLLANQHDGHNWPSVSQIWYNEMGFKTGDYRTWTDLVDADYRYADGAARILNTYNHNTENSEHFESSYAHGIDLDDLANKIAVDPYFPSSGDRNFLGSAYLQISTEFYQKSVADADIISLALGNTNFGTYMLSHMLEVIRATPVEEGQEGYEKYIAKMQAFNNEYDMENVFRLAEMDPALEAEVRKLIDESEVIINEVFGDMSGGRSEKAEALKNIITYCIVSYAVNYIGSVEAILALNPDVDLIQIALMNAYAEDGAEEAVEGVTIGDIVDLLYTPVNAFIAAVPTYMQATGNYQDANFYYAQAETVESMVAVYGDDFYNDKVTGENIPYPGWEFDPEKMVANPDSLVRERFIEEGDGIVKGMVFDALKAVVNEDSYGYNLRTDLTVDEVAEYEALSNADKAVFAKDDPATALSIAFYLAFEHAMIEAGTGTVTVESMLATSAVLEAFGDVMTVFRANMLTAQAQNKSDVYAGMAKIIKTTLANKGLNVEVTVDDVEMILGGQAEDVVNGFIAQLATPYISDIQSTANTSVVDGLNTLFSGLESYLSSCGAPDLVVDVYIDLTSQETAATAILADDQNNWAALRQYIYGVLPETLSDGNKQTIVGECVTNATDTLNALVQGALIATNQDAAIEAARPTVLNTIAGGMGNIESSAVVSTIATMLSTNVTADGVDLLCMMLALPQTLSDAMVGNEEKGIERNDTVCGLLCMNARLIIGTGIGGHPSPGGHDALFKAVKEAYETEYTSLQKTLDNVMYVITEYYDEAYAYAYAEAVKAGYIDKAVAGIDTVIAALPNDLDDAGLTDELEAKAEAEIAAIIATLKAAKALITEADVLDDAAFKALMDLLNEAGEALEQLVDVLEQAGVDVNNLVIIPALEEAYRVLVEEVLPEIEANLQKAVAKGTAWLMDKAEDAIDAVIEALPEMAQFAHDYVLDFLLNNPEDVIAFFNEYGDEIIVAVEEYGPYALVAMGYIAVTYDQEILNFVMENDEEILEVTAMLLKEHGPHAVELIKVYAEATGLCALIQDEIDKIEDQIADLREQLEEELYKQLTELEKQLDDLYAALEDAAGDVAEEIQAAIDAIEDVIAEVEAAIEAIEAAIADLEAQLAEAQKALEEAIAAVEAVVEAIKAAIENGVETVEEILAAIDAIVDFAEETIAGVKTAIDGIVKAVEDVVDFVDELIANGIVAAEMIEEIIDTVMDIIDGVKAELEKGDIEAAIEEIRNQLTAGYEELQAMLAAIDVAIAEQLDAIVGDLEAALEQAQDEFEEALYNATHGELACDAKTIAVYGGETVATEDGYAAIVAEEWGLTQTEAVDMADVILYQADPQIFVSALLNSVNGSTADWTKYISDESVLAYLEQAKAELVDVLAAEYGEDVAAVAEPLVDSFLFAVVEYAVANIETIEYLSRINEDALIVAAGMYNPVQGLSVTYGGETIDIEAMCQYLIEVTDVYNLLYAIAAQNAVFVDVSEAEAAAFDNVDVDSLLARAMALKAEAIALFAEAQKALEENDFNKASALMEQANALYTEIDNIVSEVLPLVESLDSSYATEAGHAYIAAQILAAIEKADHECEWAIDDNEHCYYCVNCGEEFVCGAHEFDGEEDAVCDICGYTRVIFDDPEVTTSSIVVFYWNENNAAIKEATVEEITTTGSYAFNIPAIDNYNFVNVIDKDENDDNDYDVAQDNTSFTVNVNTMPTSGSALEFVLKYVAAGGGEEDETIAVTGVALDKETLSLKVGNTAALTATVTPDNATNKAVTWASSDESVATVADGVVTAVAKGTATITVTTVDGSFTDTCAVTVTTSGGGSFGGGGGGGYIKPAKPEVLVPDNAVADGVTVTVDHIDYLTVNEVKDLVAKDDNLEVIGGRDSGALVAVKPANAVTSFAHPVQLTVPVSKSALQNVDDVNKLTLALVTTDAQGNIQLTYVGGNYDASKGTFIAYVNQPGKYVLMEKLDIVKLELTIDRYVVFVNGEPIINDVPSRIVNNRTIVPAARVLHHMGCTVEWLSDTRTVAVTLPNGDVLNLPVDEPIPGFGAAPVIENGRTLVPIAYIADMMDAHVQWVGNDRKVIIVK